MYKHEFSDEYLRLKATLYMMLFNEGVVDIPLGPNSSGPDSKDCND